MTNFAEIIGKTVRCVQGSRLVYYREKADEQFWDKQWLQHVFPETYARADKGELGLLRDPFIQYLPKRGCILEAGCGIGKYVLALRKLGYDVEGVEWAKATVQAVRSIRPDIPIRVEDVTHLNVPDGYYSAYISLGVVEHCIDGPEIFLQEARRVLTPGGIILVSVPYFHRLRQLRSRLGFYRQSLTGLEFYQYVFTEEEFLSILRRMSFEIINIFGYNVVGGLRSEVPYLHLLLENRFFGTLLRQQINQNSYLQRHFGHMLLVVAQAQ